MHHLLLSKTICIYFYLHENLVKQTGFVNHSCKWFLAVVWFCICKVSQVSFLHRAEKRLSKKKKQAPNRSPFSWLSATIQRCNFFSIFPAFCPSKWHSKIHMSTSFCLITQLTPICTLLFLFWKGVVLVYEETVTSGKWMIQQSQQIFSKILFLSIQHEICNIFPQRRWNFFSSMFVLTAPHRKPAKQKFAWGILGN